MLITQVESDFTFLYGQKNEVLDNLKTFCDLMVDNIFPKRIKNLKESGDIELFEKLRVAKDSLSNGKY